MRELDELFAALAKSAFRRKFHLQGKDLEYLHNKGLTTVLSHANDFISKRLAPAFPEKDGKQTPFRGHPVYPVILSPTSETQASEYSLRGRGIKTGMSAQSLRARG